MKLLFPIIILIIILTIISIYILMNNETSKLDIKTSEDQPSSEIGSENNTNKPQNNQNINQTDQQSVISSWDSGLVNGVTDSRQYTEDPASLISQQTPIDIPATPVIPTPDSIADIIPYEKPPTIKGKLMITSSGFLLPGRIACESHKLTPTLKSGVELVTISDKTQTPIIINQYEGTRGFNVVLVDSVSGMFKGMTWDTHEKNYDNIVSTLEENTIPETGYIIYFCHDACTHKLPSAVKDLLAPSLPNFLRMGYRSPYIGVIDGYGKVIIDKVGPENCGAKILEEVEI